MTDLFVLPSHPYSNEADYAFAMEHSPIVNRVLSIQSCHCNPSFIHFVLVMPYGPSSCCLYFVIAGRSLLCCCPGCSL